MRHLITSLIVLFAHLIRSILIYLIIIVRAEVVYRPVSRTSPTGPNKHLSLVITLFIYCVSLHIIEM